MINDAESPKTLAPAEAQRRLETLIAHKIVPQGTTMEALADVKPHNFARAGTFSLAADPEGHLQLAGLLYVTGYLDSPFTSAEALRADIYPGEAGRERAGNYEKALHAYLTDRSPETLKKIGAVGENLFYTAERNGSDEANWRYDVPAVTQANETWSDVFSKLKQDAKTVAGGTTLEKIPAPVPVVPDDAKLAGALLQFFDDKKEKRKPGDHSNQLGTNEMAQMLAALNGRDLSAAEIKARPGLREDAKDLIKQADASGFLSGGKGKLNAAELTALLKENGELREQAERWFVREAESVTAPVGGSKTQKDGRGQ